MRANRLPSSMKGQVYTRAPRSAGNAKAPQRKFTLTDMSDPEQVRKLSHLGICKTVACLDCGAVVGQNCISRNDLPLPKAHQSRRHQGYRHVRALLARLDAKSVAS